MLANLARYYLDCLSHDDLGGVSVYAANRFGPTDYVELPAFPGAGPASDRIPDTPEVRQLQKRVQSDRNRRSLVVGYPVRLNPVRATNGEWSTFKVEPLCLFALDETPGDLPPEKIDSLK